jgi:2-hydroxychromene-2-carboxylate isomerase
LGFIWSTNGHSAAAQPTPTNAFAACAWLHSARARRQAGRVPRAACEAYWGDDQDISKDEVLAEICRKLTIDPQHFFTGIGQQAIKDQLRVNTDELMERDGFGSPTIYLDRDDMYFGNDRLPLLRATLERRSSLAGR